MVKNFFYSCFFLGIVFLSGNYIKTHLSLLTIYEKKAASVTSWRDNQLNESMIDFLAPYETAYYELQDVKKTKSYSASLREGELNLNFFEEDKVALKKVAKIVFLVLVIFIALTLIFFYSLRFLKEYLAEIINQNITDGEEKEEKKEAPNLDSVPATCMQSWLEHRQKLLSFADPDTIIGYLSGDAEDCQRLKAKQHKQRDIAIDEDHKKITDKMDMVLKNANERNKFVNKFSTS